MRLLWLADACRAAGLAVVEVDGWARRGAGDLEPQGVVVHSTRGPRGGDLPSLPVLRDGRDDLPGPLAHLAVGRSGTVYVIASGRAHHAGAGGWRGVSGERFVVGVQAEHDGGGAGWPQSQREACASVCAAVLRGIGRDAAALCGHHEWAPWRARDPVGLAMPALRAAVRRVLELT